MKKTVFFILPIIACFLLLTCNTLDQAYDENSPGAGRIIHADHGPVEIDVYKYQQGFVTKYVAGIDTGAIFAVLSHNGRGRISLANKGRIIDDLHVNNSQFSILHCGDSTGWSIATKGDDVTFNLRDWIYDSLNFVYLDDSTFGKVGIGAFNPTAKLDVRGRTGYDQVRMRTPFYPPPKTSKDTRGHVGDIAWDDSHFYVKTHKGWKRTQLESF